MSSQPGKPFLGGKKCVPDPGNRFLGAKNAFPTRESIFRASGGRPDSGGHLPRSGNIKNVKWKEGKQYTPRPRRFRK